MQFCINYNCNLVVFFIARQRGKEQWMKNIVDAIHDMHLRIEKHTLVNASL